jgi:hypothetical protein
MKQLHFQEKYPITVMDVAKSETRFQSAAEIADYFRSHIDTVSDTVYIGTFDHFEHTKSIGGEIAPDIKAAMNVLFCFGKALPDPRLLSVRPRSIGITDVGDHFVISFMDAPMKPANDTMQSWALGLRHK